jgi:WD40 repeat protein
MFFVVYMDKKTTGIRIFDFASVLNSGDNAPKIVKEITPNAVTEYTCAVWGPLNKTLYVGTKTGKIQIIDVGSATVLKDTQVHTADIYQLTFSHDHTMLFTGSRDGTTKLLHPETFEEIRTYNFGGRPCRTVAVSPLHDSQEW